MFVPGSGGLRGMSGRAEESADILRREARGLSLPQHARVLVAVSGGPDSVALLDALRHVASEPERLWELRVGHVNHQLRGREADEDESFVRQLAATCELTCEVATVDTRVYAARGHLSLETAAREVRRSALTSLLRSWGGGVIALGHTQDDQAETVLLRLLRGAGVTGLGGMRCRDGVFVRPFLGVSRQTIMRALGERELAFRQDSTNTDLHFARNRIRHQVWPALLPLQPRLAERIAQTAALLQTEADFMLREAERVLPLLQAARAGGEISASRPIWLALHPALQRHTVRLLLTELLGHLRDIEERHVAAIIAAIRGEQPGRLVGRLPQDVALYVTGERFALRQSERPLPRPLETREVSVPGSVQLEAGEFTVTVHEMSPELRDYATVSGPYQALCDADTLGPTLTVRARQAGDRITQAGGTRKLQDLLIDRHVPQDERSRVPVVADEKGVIWVVGLARNERRALGAATRRVAWLTFTPQPTPAAICPRGTAGQDQES